MENIKNSVPLSLKEIGGIVEDEKLKCRWCSNPLKSVNVRSKPHEGGIYVKGFEDKQWVYFHCFRCDYDWSLDKILDRWVNK